MPNMIGKAGLGHLLRGGVLRFGGEMLSVDVQLAPEVTPDVVLAELAEVLGEPAPQVLPMDGAHASADGPGPGAA